MTIGRLNSAASSVAVPLAISVRSQAASASCSAAVEHLQVELAGELRHHRIEQVAHAAHGRQHEAQVGVLLGQPRRRTQQGRAMWRTCRAGCPAAARSRAHPAAGRAQPVRPRAAPPADRVGQRMADIARRCRRAGRSPARRGTGTAHGRPPRGSCGSARPASGPDRRADEVDGLRAGLLQPGLQAEVEVGHVDPDEGVGCSFSSRSPSSARSETASAAAAAAPGCSRAPPAGRSSTRPQALGLHLRAAQPEDCSAGQRCFSPPSSGGRAGRRRARRPPCPGADRSSSSSACRPVSARCPGRPGQEVEHHRDVGLGLGMLGAASRSRRGRPPASGPAVERAVHLPDGQDALRAEAAATRPSWLKPLRLAGCRHHHEGRRPARCARRIPPSRARRPG